MESARPRIVRRRPRRGSIERPVNVRLVRSASLVLVVPVLLLGFTIARPGPLPPSPLPSTFDGPTSTRLTRDLARDYPTRVPGSAGARRAAGWYREQLALYALPVRVDTWQEDVPGLGRVELQNLVTVVPGQSSEAIAVVAHRDNRPETSGANDNASGTAALIELARPYARSALGTPGVQPLHTLVFVSTDAGAYGAAGMRRFVRTPQGRRVVTAIVLDGISGPERPVVRVGGVGGRSPAPSLVRTLTARVDDALPAGIRRPGLLEQAVGLGLRFGYGEQAVLLDAGVAAVRFGNAGDGVPLSGSDEPVGIRAGMVARLGGAAEATLASLDQGVALPRSTHGYLFLGDRAIRGWSLQLLLVSLLVPFAAMLVDLHVRLRRRGVRIGPAFAAVRRRLGFWLTVGGAVLLASLAGVFAHDRDGVPSAGDPAYGSWPVVGLILLGLAIVLAWLVARMRLLPRRPVTVEEEVAGQLAGLVTLGAAAVLTALANPYALGFLAPSILAWAWLPQLGGRPRWLRDLLYGIGLVAPPLVLVVLAAQLDLGARSVLYAVSLATTGIVPWLQTLALLVWTAAAAQLGAVEAGRYAPGRESG